MEALLKASEASALMGVSMRHVRRMAQSGALSYQIHMNAQNRPEYLFPLSSLPDAAQQKYFAEHAPAALSAAAPAKAKKADKPAACKPLEAYTAEERGEIGYWITTVDRWQTYRNKAGTKKAECDEKFVLLCRMEEPDRQISVETLYRKWATIREGDYGALVDMRGKARKGMSKMPEAIERVFLSLFLDESQLPVPRCIALTEEWAQQNMPEAMPLPGYHTFYRKAKAVPYPVMVLCRMGEKKYYDLCSPYIRREYESINANDFWVGDTHTLDVESMGPDGTLHRLYLSAWLDARSGIFTGWYVTDSPGSQATLNALRKGILSPEDIQQLIKRPQMQGIGAVGNAGALFTCEKVFGYSQKNAEGWFKALKKKYPLYKGESGKIEDALAQRIAFAEELRRDGAKYGLIFSR